MTAEISILNKNAVALAADSAVTLRTRYAPKIYNTVNKLFNLNKNYPVGIMIYGNADIMGVPWETIIKIYRKKIGRTEFDTIEEQANDFIYFLEKSKEFFPHNLQNKYINTRIYNFYKYIYDEIKNRVDEKRQNKEIKKREIQKITKDVIENIFKQIIKNDFIEGFDKKDIIYFFNNFQSGLENYKNKIFKDIKISSNIFEILKKSVANILFRDVFGNNTLTGIVITGFGKKEYYPSIVYYKMEGMMFDKLKYKQNNKSKIDEEKIALIIPFAQSDMAATFIEGINPLYKNNIEYEIYKTNKYFSNEIKKIQELNDIDVDKKNILIDKITNSNRKVLTDLYDNMIKHQRTKHVKPIINAVSFLPKEELAIMAESLVYLTYLKRRISIDAETVGGAIDVAIITKGEGFIWIKRKHYFDVKLNPHYNP